MTPSQMAKSECANMDSDGRCLFIGPSSNDDYSVPLPGWLAEETWRRRVAEARQHGLKVLHLHFPTGDWFDMDGAAQKPPSRNGLNLRWLRRYDFYYCDGCGRRMGVRDQLCLDCWGLPHVPDDVDRRCLVGRGKRCRYFERCVLPIADNPSPKDDPGLQGRRLKGRKAYWAQFLPVGPRPDRPSEQRRERRCTCGALLGKGRRYCTNCAAKRRRDSYRKRRDRQRGPRHS